MSEVTFLLFSFSVGLTISISNEDPFVGETLSLTCEVNLFPPVIEYRFIQNEKELYRGSSNTCNLTVEDTDHTYSCQALNSIGTYLASVKIPCKY